ncbi:MAG: phosphatidate cytidylyltransferase [Candidatus Cloacimonetes bacterium]|nr:phosphatidate cytidylyltransferase [Candidatus Cloacimonadota bacterium]
MKEFTIRTLAALVYGPLMLLFAWLAGLPLQIFITIIALIGITEYYHLLKKRKNLHLHYSFLVIATVLTHFLIFVSGINYIIFLFLFFLIILFIIELMHNKVTQATPRISYSFFGLFYIPLTLEFLYLITEFPRGNYILMFLMVLVWITDTSAYVIGSKFGKVRNIFAASRNKSISGFIAGIASAFIFCYLLNYLIGIIFHTKLLATGADCFALSIIVGIFDQIGDLIESTLKRFLGVKDSSHIIPGHGGILDRYDSLMITAPLLYFYLNFLK